MAFNLEDEVAHITDIIIEELTLKLETQGHGKRETSNLIKSFEAVITNTAGNIAALFFAEDYYLYVNKGVSASRIPYTVGGPRRGGTSKYIQGLIRFWVRKGLNSKEAKSAAFATSNKHKKEGMSTINSRKFSKDGTRNGFIDMTLNSLENRIVEIAERGFGDKIDIQLNLIGDRVQRLFSGV